MASDATRFIRRHAEDRQLKGSVTREQLREAFHRPGRGVVLLDGVLLKRVIRAHRALPEFAFHVPRADAYLIGRDDLLSVLRGIEPSLGDQLAKELPAELPVSLLAEPETDALESYNLEFFARDLWGQLVYTAVWRELLARQAAGRLTDGGVRGAVADLGLVELEEAREVLSGEHQLFDPKDDREVLCELLASWVQLDLFSAPLVEQFFPSLAARRERVEALLASLDIEPRALLRAWRPDGAPSVELLLREREQSADEAELEVHKLTFHLGKLMGDLERELESADPAEAATVQARFEPVVTALVERFIKRDRIVGGLTFDAVRAELHRREHRDPRVMLLFDRVLAAHLGPLYRGARRSERQALGRVEGDSAALYDARLKAIDDKTAARMRRRWERFVAGRYGGWLRWQLGRLLAALLFVAYRWLLELAAWQLSGFTGWARALWARGQVRRFADHLRAAAIYARFGNPAGSAVALRRALARLERATGERAEAAVELAALIGDELNLRRQALVEQLAEQHRLDAEARATAQELVEFLIDRACVKPRGIELRLLFDLQDSARKGARRYRGVELWTFLRTLGRQPLVIDLPFMAAQQQVLHLLRARRRLGALHVKREDTRRFDALIASALATHESSLRERIEPQISGALHSVGLEAETFSERAGRRRLAGELADTAVAGRRINFPLVRDALSRNDLKLPDLTLPDAVLGDPLLRLDDDLQLRLPGAYAAAPIYLRLLQWVNAPFYATYLGRLLVLFVLLPFIGSYILLVGVEHTVGVLLHKLVPGFSHFPFVHIEKHKVVVDGIEKLVKHETVVPSWWIGTGLVLLAIINFSWGRAIAMRVLGLIGDAFAWCWRLVWASLMSQFVALMARLFVLPMGLALTVAGLAVLILRELRQFNAIGGWLTRHNAGADSGLLALLKIPQVQIWGLTSLLVLYAVFAIAINSVLGRRLRDHAAHLVADTALRLKKTLWSGLVLVVLQSFTQAMNWIEHIRYQVENSLRFTAEDGRLSFLAKTLLGMVWFWISYVLALYVILLIEPQINPIKHFPVVTVAHKLMIPMLPSLSTQMYGVLSPFVPAVIALPFVAFTIFVLPGLAGFLVWELKENWKLYRANRPSNVPAAIVGSHGETLPRLLRRGFHSGTIPKTLAKLRRAGKRASQTGDWSQVNKLRHDLHHIDEDISRFVRRGLFFSIREDPVLSAALADLQAGHGKMTNNKIAVELTLTGADGSQCTLWLRFEDVFSWIIGSVSHDREAYEAVLPSEELRARMDVHLNVFFKLSGVELVREQVEQQLVDRLDRWRGELPGLPDRPLLGYETGESEVALAAYDATGEVLIGRVVCPLDQDPVQPWLERSGERVATLEAIPRHELVFADWAVHPETVDRCVAADALPASAAADPAARGDDAPAVEDAERGDDAAAADEVLSVQQATPGDEAASGGEAAPVEQATPGDDAAPAHEAPLGGVVPSGSDAPSASAVAEVSPLLSRFVPISRIDQLQFRGID